MQCLQRGVLGDDSGKVNRGLTVQGPAAVVRSLDFI